MHINLLAYILIKTSNLYIVFSDTFEDCTKRKINCITMNLNALLIN